MSFHLKGRIKYLVMLYIFKGFKFGMLLQLAVGPICLFIFNIAASFGFFTALSAVMAVVIADSLEMGLSILGINTFLKKYKTAKFILKYFGILVLFIFGISNIFSAINGNAPIISSNYESSVFFLTLIITLSNPLTIIFWTGIFSAKINQDNLQQSALHKFALGCITATFFFLSFISLAGSIFHTFLPAYLLSLLNIFVGLFMIFFALKIILSKTPS